MLELENILDLVMDNLKKLLFPGEWISLDLKFSKSEIFTMFLIDKRKEITMTELADYINSPMSTATGIVDRLVKNNYLIRSRSDTDRRIVVLRLTEQGSQFLEHFKNLLNGYIINIFDDLSEDEKQFFIVIIFKIINNIESKLKTNIPSEQNHKELTEIEIE
jgi:DNA-binding MarR family transcriptional regulator